MDILARNRPLLGPVKHVFLLWTFCVFTPPSIFIQKTDVEDFLCPLGTGILSKSFRPRNLLSADALKSQTVIYFGDG